jgi:hypothetical protein
MEEYNRSASLFLVSIALLSAQMKHRRSCARVRELRSDFVSPRQNRSWVGVRPWYLHSFLPALTRIRWFPSWPSQSSSTDEGLIAVVPISTAATMVSFPNIISMKPRYRAGIH